MPAKYECPVCGRRFTEWGAEKVGFGCPGDEWCPKERPDKIELVRVGASEDRPKKKPSLKRQRRIPTPKKVAPPVEEDEALDGEFATDVDPDEIDEDEETIPVTKPESTGPVAKPSDDDDSVDDDSEEKELDIEEDLTFDSGTPKLGHEAAPGWEAEEE